MSAARDVPRFGDPARIVRPAALVGVIGLGLTAAGAALDVKQAAWSYLLGWAFWTGIAIASLTWLGAFHAARARWMIVLRRPIEAMTGTLGMLAILFIPVLFFLRSIYDWVDPIAAGLPAEELRITTEKQAWLNPVAFGIRGVVYFAIWLAASLVLRGWSLRQDETGELSLTVKQRQLGAGMLPLVGLSASFAAFDWLMSLDPTWYSTIFGLYWWAGSFDAAMAVLVIVAYQLEKAGPLAGMLRRAHWHSLGKLLFAFDCFWAYIAFSQLLLIWIADLPEETTWYHVRLYGPWSAVFALLALGRFAGPFLVLLSRDIKLRPRALAWIAGWLLFMQWVDVYWIVMPRLHPASIWPRWTDLAATLGVGGLVVAWAAARARGRAAVPAKDPYLADSLRYGT